MPLPSLFGGVPQRLYLKMIATFVLLGRGSGAEFCLTTQRQGLAKHPPPRRGVTKQ